MQYAHSYRIHATHSHTQTFIHTRTHTYAPDFLRNVFGALFVGLSKLFLCCRLLRHLRTVTDRCLRKRSVTSCECDLTLVGTCWDILGSSNSVYTSLMQFSISSELELV